MKLSSKELSWEGTEYREGARFYWIGCFIKEGRLSETGISTSKGLDACRKRQVLWCVAKAQELLC